MRNRLLVVGMGLVVIGVLIFLAFAAKGSSKISSLPGQNSIKKLILEGKLDDAKKIIDGLAEKTSNTRMLGGLYFELASSYENKKALVKARDIYNSILTKYQNVDNIADVQERLGRLNRDILFSRTITDKDVLYEVQPGDTLSKIAKKFGTTIELIKASNSLKTDSINAHSKIKVSKAKYKLLIDKSQNLLSVLSDGNIVKVYRVSTGGNNSTPVGTFKIVNRIKDPVWYTQGAVVPAESPDNILGSHWLGLSEPGYGIHGTTDPESVGRQATKGCVRMHNSDVEELFTIVPVGTEVAIVD